jgi:tRNA dimethylallyltransferase
VEREVVVITGPTASGKTEVSIHLAGILNSEIISADSRQFYKHLDIGTAKPSETDLNRVKHHFINSLEPDQEYNVSLYAEEALEICKQLWSGGKVPIVTGGSGLYLKSLVDGLSDTPDPDPEIRDQLIKEKSIYGNEYLYDKLRMIDPESASKMLPQNWKRVIRALEVYYLTGKPIWQHHSENKDRLNMEALQYAPLWDREMLYSRINSRTDKMIEDGFISEVKNILSMGFNKELNSLNTVGYKEIIAYLEGQLTLEQSVDLIKRNTRRYAKRQLTWFRKDYRIKWTSIKSKGELLIFAENIAAEFLKRGTEKQ